MSNNDTNQVKSDGTMKLYWIVSTSNKTENIRGVISGPYTNPPSSHQRNSSDKTEKIVCVEVPFTFFREVIEPCQS
jgi:hypothetical protein